MKKVVKIFGLLAILFFLITPLSYAETPDKLGSRTISVSARGEVEAIPDIANFSFSVHKDGGLYLEYIQGLHTEILNKSMVVLENNGIEKENIKTTNYIIRPRHSYNSQDRTNRLIGYSVSVTVNVKLKDISKYGLILVKLGQSGITNINGPHFSFSNPIELANKALAQAVTRAVEIAKIATKTAGVELGRIITITPNANTPSKYAPKIQGIAEMATRDNAPPKIEAGTEIITASVTIIYKIVDKDNVE